MGGATRVRTLRVASILLLIGLPTVRVVRAQQTSDPSPSYQGYYASYVASVFGPAVVTITATPIGNTPTGETLGATISGNRITMAKGGRPVYIDYRVSDWDPTDSGKRLRAYQIAVDPAGYTSGLQGILTPRLVACTDHSQCDPAYGVGSACDFPTGCGGVPPCFCTAMYIDITRGAPNPWAMAGTSGGALCAVDLACVAGVCTQDYRGGCSGITGGNNDPVPFPAGGLYLATLVLDVPADAKGDFMVGMKPPNDTSLVDQNNAFYEPLGLVPAHIELPLADLDGDLDLDLDDLAIFVECLGGPGVNEPPDTCTTEQFHAADFDGDDDVDLADADVLWRSFTIPPP